MQIGVLRNRRSHLPSLRSLSKGPKPLEVVAADLALGLSKRLLYDARTLPTEVQAELARRGLTPGVFVPPGTPDPE
jgi:hypothetical protein